MKRPKPSIATVISMCLVASVLLYLNTIERKIDLDELGYGRFPFLVKFSEWGFPFPCYYKNPDPNSPYELGFDSKGVLLNLAVGIWFMAVTYSIVELTVRKSRIFRWRDLK